MDCVLALVFDCVWCVGGCRGPGAWQYLVESIRQFPTQEAFLGMLNTAGFSLSTYTNLSLGVVAIHSGFKLPLRPVPA